MKLSDKELNGRDEEETDVARKASSGSKHCGRHFVGAGLVSYLRNNSANHNNADDMLKIANARDDEAEFTFSLSRSDNKYFEYATKVRLLAIASHLKLPEMDWDKVIARMTDNYFGLRACSTR